ncbi:alpha/beta hydrolase [Dyadobacter arcticus]|uniref:Alpha/beta superfamily hydrolase n=1 Tax=Dyadobacter arcticus TaxID=1078754 RepID=A0ABX0UFL6_9BACT|nr:alpha/beta hydrolase-fold protein [Dyadobacter arcticus]NIJ51776.1 putative alpha/beta superfamily hydrolase [Dyadobacter arcticus]
MQVVVETLIIELSTPAFDKRPVYITGNFCKWLPDLQEFQMINVSSGKYQFQFPETMELPDPLEYKYTRGGWDQVELDRFGKPYGNRVAVKGDGIVQDTVARWQIDNSEKTDFSPIVELVSDTFEIPQFNKTRRIQVLLPHDYYERPDLSFPVLYMNDAQNLFGEGSPYGNWEIDQSLTKLAKEHKTGVIIVAIDHGGEDRILEFSPYTNPKLGKGQGELFLRFIATTLKPHIDKKYRTKPERLNTGIGGSSVGGLLSLYAALMFPQVFGKMMIFSPSLWISQRVYFDVIHFFEPFESRIYLYAGGKEGANMLPNFKKLQETLETQAFGYDRVKIKSSIDPKGKHEEKQWSQEFPLAMKWLFLE